MIKHLVKHPVAKLLYFACLIFLLGSCFAKCKTMPALKEASLNRNIKAYQQLEALKLFRENFLMSPGQVTLLSFPYYGPFIDEELICNGKKIPFFVSHDKFQAFSYLSLSYFHEEPDFSCIFRFSNDDKSEYMQANISQISIQSFNYPQEAVYTDNAKVDLSLRDQERVQREKSMIDFIQKQSASIPLFDEPFSPPLNSKITSTFGVKRIFNDSLKTQHLGTDFRACEGTPIPATNKGIVVFAGDLFYGGNTVIIDHGLGIFTSYSHLSKISVNLSQRVDKKTTVGLSGKTGRVSGPHLHWGALVHGNWNDGYSLIEQSKKNFPARNKAQAQLENILGN